MTKRSWRCIGLTLLALCPAFLLNKGFISQGTTQYFTIINHGSKSGKENAHRREDDWGFMHHGYKIDERKRLLGQDYINHESRHHNVISPRQKNLSTVNHDQTHAKKRQIQASQGTTRNPSPQPFRSSLLFNPSVATLLDSWDESSVSKPVAPPQLLDQKIVELVASWGDGGPIPVQTSNLTSSSVDDILQSWYEQAQYSLLAGAIDGGARKKGMTKEKGVKGKMSKGQTVAPISIFPTPSETTYFPTSSNIGKGPKGMGNMMKGKTDAPVTVFPSPAVSTFLPSSTNSGKGMSGMSKSKKQTDTPVTFSPSPSVSTIFPSSTNSGKGMKGMGKSKKQTDAPSTATIAPTTTSKIPVLTPSTVQTTDPTAVSPSPTSPSPVKGGKGMYSKMGKMSSSPKSKGKGMNVITPTQLAPTTPPLLTPNAPAIAPGLPTPPTPPVPLNNPMTTPVNIPVTPSAPVQPTPINTPIATPNSIPVSTPFTSPAAPVTLPNSIPVTTAPVASPIISVPTPTPPTNAPQLTPAAPTAPTPGNPVAASPYQVLYAPVFGPITAANFASATDVTCAHVEQAIMDVIAMSPFIVVNDISCQSVTTAAAPTAILFETTVVFDPSSTIFLTTGDIDQIISTAFQSPQVSTLISDLNMLPTDNPFSSTAMVTYSVV